ncbi:serine carboxypeptidase-like [Salvia splendens]|uniref:serine carboxypeptidase-like n=1 Tax=Salvia splendens TaxID=180675 RepID=UPI00110035DF|nr:serine carboxypeptidase-like [Salvia splendens]
MSTLFLCISLLISLSAIEADNGNASPILASKFLQKQAEKLIRDLNLFPKLDANIVEDDPAAADASRIVEKRIQFPHIAANSTTVADFGHHAGYYRLASTKGARLFYYFFESRSKNSSAPVVVWLTGGPGCSSSLALFFENGPFHLTKDYTLAWNEFGWDQESNLIYIDQPTGTGFSYSTSTDDLRHSSEEASVDFSDFLQAFFEKHGELAKNDFYITGESYAGHYIPAFAAQIHQRNKNRQGIHINLKGLAIGNGMTNPEIQYKSYRDYALNMKLINRVEYYRLIVAERFCETNIRACGANGTSLACAEAYIICTGLFRRIIASKPGINHYDIRKNCTGSLCYDFSIVERFLNDKAVQNALGVRDIRFISCSTKVYEYMYPEIMKNFDVGLPALLQDGIKLLVYAGEYDLICNWLGNLRWVENMSWSGRRRFVSAKLVPFKVGGVEAGGMKSYGGLSFLKVYNAGHMVPMDQPRASLEMLRRWMQGQFR